jgi:hypothetical protein
MAIDYEKTCRPFHCQHCGLLMMVRPPGSPSEETKSLTYSGVGWRCPFCDCLYPLNQHTLKPSFIKKYIGLQNRQKAEVNV